MKVGDLVRSNCVIYGSDKGLALLLLSITTPGMFKSFGPVIMRLPCGIL